MGSAGRSLAAGRKNGGNGAGVSLEVGYTLTARDRHGVCMPYQRVVGTLCSGDEKGVGNQYVSDAKCIIAPKNRVRRLTPLECERLQGFPDGWTDIPGASDTARYKALGNSVAVPCVETVLAAVQNYLRWEEKRLRKYIYPQDLTARATMWLWQLNDLAAIGALCLAGVFCAAQFGTAAPLLCAAGYAFLTVRFEGQSIRDFLHSAGA